MQLIWGKFTDSLGKQDLKDLFKVVSNYCLPKVKNGHKEYTQRIYKLYEFLFDRRLMFAGKYIHQLHLSNITVLGCRLNKTERAFELNEMYRQHIHPKFRKNVYL